MTVVAGSVVVEVVLRSRCCGERCYCRALLQGDVVVRGRYCKESLLQRNVVQGTSFQETSLLHGRRCMKSSLRGRTLR